MVVHLASYPDLLAAVFLACSTNAGVRRPGYEAMVHHLWGECLRCYKWYNGFVMKNSMIEPHSPIYKSLGWLGVTLV